MDNKAIQEQRLRGYFIEATKEMLKGEGLRSLSVRSIADRAGYSYATMYNYFRDVKELVFECVKDFQEECESYIKNETKKSPLGIERIKATTKGYMKFFIQYPGIFELFFIEKMNAINGKQPTVEVICYFLDRLCQDDWNYCIRKKILTQEIADKKMKELRYNSTGMLLIYLNRQQPSTYNDFIKLIDIQLNEILGNLA